MRNVQINTTPHTVGYIGGFPPDLCLKYSNKKQQVWKAFLSCLTRTNTLRNTFSIKCSVSPRSDVQDPIPEWMYQRLIVLRRFRTVSVELEFESYPKIRRFEDTDVELEFQSYPKILGFKHTGVDPKPMMEAMEKYLGHALGPGVVNCTYDGDHHWKILTLTFNPQKHMPAILRARAEILRAEADALDQEANEAQGQLGENHSIPTVP